MKQDTRIIKADIEDMIKGGTRMSKEDGFDSRYFSKEEISQIARMYYEVGSLYYGDTAGSNLDDALDKTKLTRESLFELKGIANDFGDVDIINGVNGIFEDVEEAFRRLNSAIIKMNDVRYRGPLIQYVRNIQDESGMPIEDFVD